MAGGSRCTGLAKLYSCLQVFITGVMTPQVAVWRKWDLTRETLVQTHGALSCHVYLKCRSTLPCSRTAWAYGSMAHTFLYGMRFVLARMHGLHVYSQLGHWRAHFTAQPTRDAWSRLLDDARTIASAHVLCMRFRGEMLEHNINRGACERTSSAHNRAQ